LAYRADRLKGQPELDSVVSRESLFLLNNVVLVSALFAIFLGTIFPLIAEMASGIRLSVGAPYFNSVAAPLFLLVVFLMGIGPMIAWRKASWDNLRRNLLWPALASLLSGLAIFSGGVRDFLPLLGFTLSTFVLFTIVFDFGRALWARRRIAGEGLAAAFLTLATRNQRRYGGLIVHLGIVLIVLGITGSMTYSIERQATLDVGQSLSIGSYRIRFEGLNATPGPTHLRLEGVFRVFDNRERSRLFSPALKVFPNQQSPISRAVFQSTFKEDLYLILSGFSELGQNRATLKALVRPLVAWIWLGGGVIVLGTLITIWPFGRSTGLEET
jgi:cytochrome c-type biogenesis protein CcmF